MKRVISIFLVFGLLIGLASCGQETAKIGFDFSPVDVSKIELYRYIVPADSEMKILETANDIQTIMDRLTALNVEQKNNLEEVAGGGYFAIRFYLQGGTTYEIIYTPHADGWAKIQSSYVFSYATKEDITSYWNDFDYEVQSVPESQLPVYEK
jgi:hypothetical protein